MPLSDDQTGMKITGHSGETVFEGTVADFTRATDRLVATLRKDRKMPPKKTQVSQELSAAAAAYAGVPPGQTKMKETPADAEVKDRVYRVTADELRSYIERFEQLQSEKDEIGDQQKSVMADAKARGYDTAAIRTIIRLRKMDRDKRENAEAVLQLYREALGM